MVLVQVIILLVVIFGGLVYVLHHVLTKNISRATTHLDDLNADFIVREEAIKKSQVEAQKQYDEAIIKAKDEADHIRRQTDEEMANERERILGEARQQSEQIVQKAQKTKAMIVEEIRREVEEKMVQRLLDVLRQVFPEHIQKEIHRLWVCDLLESSLKQLASMKISKTLKEIRITSAFPLTAEEKKMFLKKVKAHLGREVGLAESSDTQLVAGVVITLGDVVLDGSIAHQMKQVIGKHA